MYDAISYITSAILLSSLGVLSSRVNVEGKPRIWSDAAESMNRVLQLVEIRSLLFTLLPVMFVSGIVMTNYKGIMLIDFGMNSIQFGWVEAMFALGFVSGALLGPKLLQQNQPLHLLQYSILIVGICSLTILVLSQFMDWVWLYPVFFWSSILGFGESLMHVPTSNLILQKIPDDLRGRGIALSNSFINASYVSGFLIGGGIASSLGSMNSFAIASILLLIIFTTNK